MTITPLYAAVLTVVFIYLSVRVIGRRREARIGLGDGGDRDMLRRIRAHGNFAEYVPLALVLMALAELQQAPAWALHLIGVTLLAGRIMHALGVGREMMPPRVVGMALTFTSLSIGALANIGVSPLLGLIGAGA